MPKGRIRGEKEDKLHYMEQFTVTDDTKLRMTLAAIADKWDEATRQYLWKCYNDPKLMILYAQIRDSGVNVQGVGEARRREVIKFPNRIVYDFVDTVLTNLYGPDWMQNNKALQHELVRPWFVIPFRKM